MIRNTLLVLALIIVLASAGFSLYVRLAPLDPEVWHADPEGATRTGRPNDYLIAPGGDEEAIVTTLSAPALFERVASSFSAHPRTSQLAAGPLEGRMTFVQRSKLMGYPDVISVRVTPLDEGSRLSVWSRSRYGQSDLGVNRARLDRWIADLGL